MVIEIDPAEPDVKEVVDEIQSAVDRISTFPAAVTREGVEVRQLTFRETAVRVAVLGPDPEQTGANPVRAELALRNLTEEIRDELTALEVVSQATVQGSKDFQIDVEIPEENLRRYNLSLQAVAETLRRENLDLPGGTLKGAAQDVTIKGQARAETGDRIAQIPLVTDPSGAVLTVDDLGVVHDAFDDSSSSTRINGRPALVRGGRADGRRGPVADRRRRPRLRRRPRDAGGLSTRHLGRPQRRRAGPDGTALTQRLAGAGPGVPGPGRLFRAAARAVGLAGDSDFHIGGGHPAVFRRADLKYVVDVRLPDGPGHFGRRRDRRRGRTYIRTGRWARITCGPRSTGPRR